MNSSKDCYNNNYNLGFQNKFYNKNIDTQKNMSQHINTKQYNNDFNPPQNIDEFGDNIDME